MLIAELDLCQNERELHYSPSNVMKSRIPRSNLTY